MTLNKTFFLFFILFYQQICFSQTKVDECILGDCVNGKGTLQFSDGRKYVGNFVNSTKSGIGTFSWTNGEIYIGSFSNDMMHGDGIYYFPDGRKYIGHFKKNIKHGKGRFEWPNGKLYQGEFKNDLMKGYGIMTDLNKKSTRGIWHNGNFKKERITKHKYFLTVTSVPENAKIRILNIEPKYYPEIELSSGDYKIEVSKYGYKKITQWVAIKNTDIQLSIKLQPLASKSRSIYKPTNFISNKKKKFALVIGNSQYMQFPLKNPENDASDLVNALKSIDFNIIWDGPLLNASKRQIESAMQVFSKTLKQHNGIGFLYYAGHAVQIEGKNYILPVDERYKTKSDVKYKAIDVDWMLAQLDSTNNIANFIVLDACRNNPFNTTRSLSRGLAQANAPIGSLIAYSTTPGSTAEDGIGRNSPYAESLIEELSIPGVEVLNLFRKVGKNVMNKTHKTQTPWVSHSLTEEIYLYGQSQDVVKQKNILMKKLANMRKQQKEATEMFERAVNYAASATNNKQKKTAKEALIRANIIANQAKIKAQKLGVKYNIKQNTIGNLEDQFELKLHQQTQKFENELKRQEDIVAFKNANILNTSKSYLSYLKNCKPPCAFIDGAEKMFEVSTQREIKNDDISFRKASINGSLIALTNYLNECLLCQHKQQAKKIRNQRKKLRLHEFNLYKKALSINTPSALIAFLNSCEICNAGNIFKDWPNYITSKISKEFINKKYSPEKFKDHCSKGDCSNSVGIYQFADGREYSGAFKNNQKHGYGNFVWPNGNRYTGNFRDDKMQGAGEFYFSDDRMYIGEFNNNNKDGMGQFIWSNGRIYKGNFKDDMIHGKGKMIISKNNIIKGIWNRGELIKNPPHAQ